MSRYTRARAAAAEKSRLEQERGGIRWTREAVAGLRAAGKNKPAGPPVERAATRQADTNLKR